MTAPGRTAYDELAVGPGPTVDAVLAGTLAGAAAAAATHLGAALPAGGLVLPLAPFLAGLWAGRTAPQRALRQATTAGLLVAAWVAATSSLSVGLEGAIVRLAASLEGPERAVAEVLDDATAGGLLAASARTLALGAGAVLAAALGGLLGRSLRPVHPRPLDPWLLDHARRVALGTVALAALLPGGLSPMVGPDGLAALVVSELLFHAVAAGWTVLVVRAAWRLPRTAPETPARVAVDGLFVLVLLGALLAGRVAVGGPWPAWVAPLAAWGVAGAWLALSGRPSPPPKPPRGAVSVGQALAFAGLVVAGVLATASVRLAPALVRPLAVAPWTAAVGDPTADPPPTRALLAEADRLVATGGVTILALALGLAGATWVSRRLAARWVGEPPGPTTEDPRALPG